MDNLMHRIGLHGKSFIPMLTGFGCSVPAILATRTLESRRDRLTTMMVIPLMSCGARLPIYTLIIPAFFPSKWQAPALWLIYVIGILLAILCIRLLRNTLLKGESLPFVMELPPYRIPTLKSLARHAWLRGWLYVRKAGTTILGISIILWALTSYPRNSLSRTHAEAEAATVRSEYLAGVQSLNPLMGLAPESPLLREAAEAELEKETLQKQYYESEPEYQATEDALQQKIQALETGAEGTVLKRFRSAAEIVSKARAATTPENETDTSQQDLINHHLLTEAEASLKQNDPQAWQAATRFEYDVAGSFRETEESRPMVLRAEQMRSSMAGRIGHGLEPVLSPLGFDWRIATALIGAFAAKEVFVAQLGIVFSLGDTDAESQKLRERLRTEYTPLVGFCIMLFCLIGMPCVATVSATRIESGSWKWAALQMAGLTVLAWLVTAFVYQTGHWLGIGV
jgi:ferrous iron transport protein B